MHAVVSDFAISPFLLSKKTEPFQSRMLAMYHRLKGGRGVFLFLLILVRFAIPAEAKQTARSRKPCYWEGRHGFEAVSLLG